MEAMQNLVCDLWHGYEWTLTIADDRVADWPLMSAYWPTFALTALYLVTVYFGPKLMNSRPPFEFRWTLFLYNAGLVVLNFHICFELFTASWRLNYSYTCQHVDYSDNPDEMRIAKAIWWFYFSKLLEFFDTIFFVLRKKNGQISFLHVYHHATMFPIWWIGVKWVPGGQAFFGAMINSFVHVLMYTYYGLSALGPHMQKYLWWKKYLTRIQLVQFVAGITHSARSVYVGCRFPLWMQWALIFYAISNFALFINFYFQTYIRPKKTRPTEKRCSNGVSSLQQKQQKPCESDGEGDAVHVANGYVKMKTN